MTLNIKNPEAHRLARELSKLTGETLTEAVMQALRERVERQKTSKFDQKKFDALMRIAHDAATRMSPETKALDINEYLYDDMGLPK
ncbi:MAG: type II toxin-antitoxin system VapB family antitoxin [Micropepsaceae bacterium]